MRARERVPARFVEDSDEVDDGRGVRRQARERGRIVDVGIDDVDRRQQDQMACVLAPARRFRSPSSRRLDGDRQDRVGAGGGAWSR
jgi:hypothetical protein